MKEVFDTTHWSRQIIKNDNDLLTTARMINADINLEEDIQLVLAGERTAPNYYAADIKFLRAKLYSYINETCAGLDLSNTVSVTRYLEAASAAMRITNPNSVDYPRLMNNIFLRLHRDGCVQDYVEMVDAVFKPMLDNALMYRKAYSSLENARVMITPDDPEWEYTFNRGNERA